MDDLTLFWLGQSGFLLKTPSATIACDLYLSDFCRKKSRLDHTRKMPIPIAPEQLEPIDHFLITHAHIDHFDPETIGPIMKSQPKTQFYCPSDCKRVIAEYFPSSADRFQLVGCEKEYLLSKNMRLRPLPAAHEELTKDTDGEYIAVSYLLLLDDVHQAIVFGGDTIPFDHQARMIRSAIPANYKLSLVLPVNGRDAQRAQLGFKGNMTLDEAVDLYHQTQADCLVPCHFGMFALNDLKSPPAQEYFDKNDCRTVIPEMMKKISL
jgi:L-ascorbate metabolism protein UlaG (beta-lactamase superfamily)